MPLPSPDVISNIARALAQNQFSATQAGADAIRQGLYPDAPRPVMRGEQPGLSAPNVATSPFDLGINEQPMNYGSTANPTDAFKRLMQWSQRPTDSFSQDEPNVNSWTAQLMRYLDPRRSNI